MSSAIKKHLSKLRQPVPLRWTDLIAFYSLMLLSSFIVWSEVSGQASSVFFYPSFLANLVVCFVALYNLAGEKDRQSDLKSRDTKKLHQTLQSLWMTHLPLACAVCWLGMIWSSMGLSSDSVLVLTILSVVLNLSVMPFGSRLAFLFSLPLLIAENHMVLAGPWEDSARITVLLNLSFFIFWLGLFRMSSVFTGKPADQTPGIDRVLAELEQSRQAFQDAHHSRVQLEASAAEKERDFELALQERTKALSEANKQLNQQIALRKTISDALVKSQTRLTQAIDASHLGLIDWDIANGQFYQSSFHSQFGEKEQTSAQVIQTLKKVVHPEDYPTVRDTLNTCLKGERIEYHLQYRVQNEDDWIWIEEFGKVVDLDNNDHAARILGTRRNIQNEIFRDEQVRLAKSVFDHTSEGVFVLDPDGKFLSVNPAYQSITGHTSDELIGKAIQDVSDTPEKENVYAQMLADAKVHGRWQGELLERRHHGDYFPQWTQINAIRDDKDKLKYFAGMVSDVSDRKEADEKLDYLLNYDALTKLANRAQFKDQLHRALLRFKDSKIPFALVLLDVDRFKRFNDSFGHDAADQLLVEVARRLTKSVQKVDILARIGSNEFACIVACSKTFDVESFAERLYRSVTDQHYEIEDKELAISCSVGLALVPDDAQDIETLMQYGALAAQKAKYQGGNQIQRFDPSLLSLTHHQLELEQDLRKALDNRAIEVYYQPKLDLKKNRIMSAEALVRWEHETKGVIAPEEFVAIAEENGMITELGAYVLDSACTQIKAWSGMGFGDVSVSVNLSPRQLRDAELKNTITNAIKATGIASSLLELELTESAIVDDFDGAIALLNSLRETGIKVSVDDFGTGYSSLSYLKELPVDTLKIDRAFIDNVEYSYEQQAIVKAIIVLGNSLNLNIVAEGVENDRQLVLLKGLGCDYVQGYHVSKPVNVNDMDAILAEQHQIAVKKHKATHRAKNNA